MKLQEFDNFIENILYQIFYQWILIEYEWWWLFGIVGGLTFIIGWSIIESIIGKILLTVSLITAIFQPLLYFISPEISKKILNQIYVIPDQNIYAYLIGFVLTSVILFLLMRYFSGPLDVLKNILVKRSGLERDKRSDIRNIEYFLPKSKKPFDPGRFMKNKNKLFSGLNKRNRPCYISTDVWRSSHIDFIGTTGAGKGVAAGVLLTQSLMQGESIIVLDPKDDEYLPHVLGQAAEKASVPFYYVDLNGITPQWNPFSNKSFQEMEELFAAGFGLSEKGTDADFYRLNDRKAARMFARHIEGKKEALPKAFAEFLSLNGDSLKDSPKFIEDLEEIASLSVTHILDGLDIAQAIEEGSVIYVRGSMRNARILKLQKMFVLSVMQACENRDRETARHVCMFLDEFKYLISKPALEALGAIRDKRAHVMLAHQSLGDLRDCPKDIDPESVVASINENCAIKLAYKVRDPDTADWLARMSGQILVDDEMRSIKTTNVLTEVKNPDRMLRQTERCLIDTNMLQSLPPRCAVLYGNGLADFVFTSPIKVTKKPEYITPTIFNDFDDSKAYSNDDLSPTSGGNNSTAEGLLDVD